tara:strand:- start:23 stop:184 length:162 start_codon:yes stop_codon:yes gene_type:complete
MEAETITPVGAVFAELVEAGVGVTQNASNNFDKREGGWPYEVFNSYGLPDFLG